VCEQKRYLRVAVQDVELGGIAEFRDVGQQGEVGTLPRHIVGMAVSLKKSAGADNGDTAFECPGTLGLVISVSKDNNLVAEPVEFSAQRRDVGFQSSGSRRVRGRDDQYLHSLVTILSKSRIDPTVGHGGLV